ncbi:hypothetical protein EW146_g8550, partial [Bondarzewia mesenterica]
MDDFSGFREALSEARHIVVLAGAGLSAASGKHPPYPALISILYSFLSKGIPTFRGAGGLWREYDATALATPEAFQENPGLVWQFYHYRREAVLHAQPNVAHRAIALLCSSQDALKRIAPSALSFHLVTQNIDNLSTRALPPDTPPSAYPIEMHGNLCRVRCTACGSVETNIDSPICPALAGTEKFYDNTDLADKKQAIEEQDLPRCAKCSGLARPDVVWFGESVQNLEDIAEMLDKRCDVFIVVGTSSTVMPAGVFADVVRDHGGKVAVFNIERTYADRKADFVFLGPCEETLVAAFGLN